MCIAIDSEPACRPVEELASVVPTAAASEIAASATAWERDPALVALTLGTRQDNPDTRRKCDSAICES
jgi:hypothetical protein